MADRRTIIPNVIAAALIALCIPLLASAQSNYDPWVNGQSRDHRYDGSDRYNRERLRDSVRRVKKMSHEFERHLDSSLDYSRYNDGRLEDHANKEAGEFRQAAESLKNKLGDGRNFNRSANEARKLLQLGAHLDRFMKRSQLNLRVRSEWAQIRLDLGIIADVYGFRMADFDNQYSRPDDNQNRRNDGYYPRRSNYPGVEHNHYISWGQLPF
ncbi:MAG: hypothetical protein WCF57_02270 [Pyrinomonadaceae bacterium]